MDESANGINRTGKDNSKDMQQMLVGVKEVEIETSKPRVRSWQPTLRHFRFTSVQFLS